MNIAFTGGGTGGHVYPGLAIIEELHKHNANLSFVWIGERSGMEEKIITQTSIPFKGIKAGKLRRYFSFKNFIDPFYIMMGFFGAWRILVKEKPDLLFSKGGFVAAPCVWAAWLCKIPIFIHESDYSLGLANRLCSPFAEKIFISFEQTKTNAKAKLQSKMILSGSPVRQALQQGNPSLGRKEWLTDENMQLILVMGGSQGAKAINDLVLGFLESKPQNCVIVHQVGAGHAHISQLDVPNYQARAYFNDELPNLIAAADLVISRAGAGAITEFGIMGKSLLLLPLAGHQSTNAQWLAQQQAVSVLYPQEATQENFNAQVLQLLGDAPLRTKLATNLHKLIKDDARSSIAQEIIQRLHS